MQFSKNIDSYEREEISTKSAIFIPNITILSDSKNFVFDIFKSEERMHFYVVKSKAIIVCFIMI